MASDPDKLKESWYRALATKNCRKVKELLETDNWLLHEGWKADDQAWVQLKFQRGWKARTALHVAARRGDVQLMGQILQLISCNGTHEVTGGDEGVCWVSANCHLLKVVDGDYGLDALAMAVVNGNQAIVNLLKKASLQCELNPFDISRDPHDHGENEDEENRAAVSRTTVSQSSEGGSSLGQNGTDISHDVDKGLVLDENGEIMVEASNQNWENMLALSKITNEILKKSGSFRQEIEELYYNDCDFNFLEISVYLFLFTFSTWKSTKQRECLIGPVRKGIFFAVKERIDLVKYLLFELKDGQGRTALHVAVDSGYQKVDTFLNVIPREGEEEDHENLNYDYLNIADSAGRTPLYRAATKDSYFAVRRLLQDSRTNVSAEITYHAHKWGADLDMDKLSCRNGFKSGSVYIPEKKLWSGGFNNKTNVLGGPGPYIEPLLEVSSTALHVAIIHKHDLIVKQLLENDPRFSPAEREQEERSLQSDTNPSVPNSRDDHSASPLILPAGRKKEEKSLQSDNDDGDDDSLCRPILRQRGKEDYLSCYRRFTWPVKDRDGYHVQRSVSAMQLTVLVGNIPILQRLLKYQEEQKQKGLISLSVSQSVENSLPSFQLAAAMGNPDTIKAFIDTPGYDPLIQDIAGNTALHYALKGKYVHFHPHLIDFVCCHHVFSWLWENDDRVSSWLADPEDRNPVTSSPTKSKWRQEDEEEKAKANQKELDHSDEKSEIAKRYGQRRGAIKLLLQAGIDIWKQNNDHRTARPQPNAPEDFVTWWYEQVAEETQRVQEKLNGAANAISVTAALVATASYVGPFQPPLGYGPDSLQVDILAVRIFAVCDNLSFYFALIAIMYSLLPSLPMPQESTFKELLKTRILVAIALLFLLPSIVFVLLAFAASYIAVIPDHGLAHDHGLTISTAVIGAFLCLTVMIRFLARLVNVLITLPKDATNEITFIGEFFMIDEVVSIIKNWKRLYS